MQPRVKMPSLWVFNHVVKATVIKLFLNMLDKINMCAIFRIKPAVELNAS